LNQQTLADLGRPEGEVTDRPEPVLIARPRDINGIKTINELSMSNSGVGNETEGTRANAGNNEAVKKKALLRLNNGLSSDNPTSKFNDESLALSSRFEYSSNFNYSGKISGTVRPSTASAVKTTPVQKVCIFRYTQIYAKTLSSFRSRRRCPKKLQSK
jgi:hypothetical protein